VARGEGVKGAATGEVAMVVEAMEVEARAPRIGPKPKPMR